MSVRIVPLGGLGEVGMNAMVVEEDGRRVLVDCGVMFPNDQVLGVEVAIPDLTYVREAGGVDAVLLTHGHEDHVGALPSLLREKPVPVYGTKFTLALVRERLEEHGLDVPLIEVQPREPFEAGPFIVEPVRVTHSIPDGVGFAIETGEGRLIHTGDFKIDLRPVSGERLDLARFTELGRDGVAVLLSDSTNSEREGFSVSESEVAAALEKRVRGARGRVFVALFASNVHRVGTLLKIAGTYGRKVVLCGRSLTRNARLARELGIVEIPDGLLVDPDTAGKLPAKELLVVTTGAQGEPGSALSRMSAGAYPVPVEPGDLVLFSSRAIPGNEIGIAQLADRLARRGADVVDRALDAIHASGHAQAEEQRILLDAVKPERFVPIHGDFRMLRTHARTAMGMGMAASDVFVIEDGEVLELGGGSMRITGSVPSGRVWLDARGGADVSEIVLRERESLSEYGLVLVTAVVDRKTGALVQGPDFTARGVARFDEGSDLRFAALTATRAAIEELPADLRTSAAAIEEALSTGVRKVFRRGDKRRPAILPIAILL